VQPVLMAAVLVALPFSMDIPWWTTTKENRRWRQHRHQHRYQHQ